MRSLCLREEVSYRRGRVLMGILWEMRSGATESVSQSAASVSSPVQRILTLAKCFSMGLLLLLLEEMMCKDREKTRGRERHFCSLSMLAGCVTPALAYGSEAYLACRESLVLCTG